MSEENFSDYFYYDESSKSCLKWKKDMYCGIVLNRKIVSVGDDAGTISLDSYWYVRLNNRGYRAHRVILSINGIDIPPNMIVDHIDGNRLNNNISNIRLVTHKGNQRNKVKSKRNTSGITGVTKRSDGYSASWHRENGKSTSKYFSIRKYGEENAFKLACEYRAKVISEMNNLGAGYTERHGE